MKLSEPKLFSSCPKCNGVGKITPDKFSLKRLLLLLIYVIIAFFVLFLIIIVIPQKNTLYGIATFLGVQILFGFFLFKDRFQTNCDTCNGEGIVLTHLNDDEKNRNDSATH